MPFYFDGANLLWTWQSEKFLKINADLAKEGLTMIVVTHEMEFAQRLKSCYLYGRSSLNKVIEEILPIKEEPGPKFLQRFLN